MCERKQPSLLTQSNQRKRNRPLKVENNNIVTRSNTNYFHNGVQILKLFLFLKRKRESNARVTMFFIIVGITYYHRNKIISLSPSSPMTQLLLYTNHNWPCQKGKHIVILNLLKKKKKLNYQFHPSTLSKD